MPSDSLDFSQRASLSEWMDEPCSYEEFRACLRDLERVNRTVFSYRPTLRWLHQFRGAQHPLHIVDVGCGGGDMLRRIERWARRTSTAVRLTGIDLNPYAAHAARSFTPQNSAIEWTTGNAFTFAPRQPIDIVLSSLFTHHLADAEIVRFLAWMDTVAARGWFINDLHRERAPYNAFKLLARVMRWHPFVQHDGPISIRRSFSTQDWRNYAREAGVADIAIATAWPARLCVGKVKA